MWEYLRKKNVFLDLFLWTVIQKKKSRSFTEEIIRL